MCGIFCCEEFPFGKEYAASRLHRMGYRGPDSSHLLERGGMVMGLARLAIVDTFAPEAAQPHLSAKERVTVFNGEIYNYLALDSSAKSEVALIGAMLDEGLDVRQFFDGDYAIANFDPSASILTLFRDRFGVVPLYYQLRPTVEVSSEARRLANPREVPAHGRVVIDVKKRRVLRKDTLPLYGATEDLVLLPAALHPLMRSTASRALHSDTGFSVALSGGLDSSLILLALHAQGFAPRECLVTYFSPLSDDLHAARVLADKLKVPLREIAIPPPSQLQESGEAAQLIEHLDAPGRPSAMRYRGALRSWFVAKHSSSRVVLGGDGGDELLGGYPCHHPDHFDLKRYRVAAKRLSTLRSMQHFNLDRTNKMGMAHSTEFRAPLLSSSFSQVALSAYWTPGKDLLRQLAKHLGAPVEVHRREAKYSPDELAVEEVPL